MDKQHAKRASHQIQLLCGPPRGFDISHPRWPRSSGSTCAGQLLALPPVSRTPGRARSLVRLRCNQSKYSSSCSSRHPGSRPSGRHPPPPPPDPSAVPPPSRSAHFLACRRAPWHLPLRGLPPFFLGGASGGSAVPSSVAPACALSRFACLARRAVSWLSFLRPPPPPPVGPSSDSFLS